MNKKKTKPPEILGVIAWYQSLGIRIPRARWGMGLGHAVDEWEHHIMVSDPRYTMYLRLDGKRVRSHIHFAF